MHPELQILLNLRLAIIADHAFRDRDPDTHLEALKSVSQEIDTYTEAHRAEFDARLRHYLSNCSYQKALDHLNA